jgi:hypothetical protein
MDSGARGKLIHDKTRSKKSCDTVPLTLQRLRLFPPIIISFILNYVTKEMIIPPPPPPPPNHLHRFDKDLDLSIDKRSLPPR